MDIEEAKEKKGGINQRPTTPPPPPPKGQGRKWEPLEEIERLILRLTEGNVDEIKEEILDELALLKPFSNINEKK